MARNCPECSRPVDGFRCDGCGWRDASAFGPAADPLHFRCANDYRGQRCSKHGTLTQNTVGDAKGGSHPGPWYCYQHFPSFVNWGKGEKTVPAGGFDAFRKTIRDWQTVIPGGRGSNPDPAGAWDAGRE